MNKPVILTGLRANNDLHLGNYFGALLPIIDMAKTRSNEYQVNLFVPDLHSFTTPIDHKKLNKQILQTLKIFVASGLPLERNNVYIYRQSYISAHSELTWILDCFTGMGQLNRMTQFKEKSGLTGKQFAETMIKYMHEMNLTPIEMLEILDTENKVELIRKDFIDDQIEHVSVGLFNYPVLMAADILLYNAKYVPVGDDQTQHLEFTRDIARKLNSQFGNLFTVPESVGSIHKFFGKDQGLRIKDLVDPTKKMSKSDDTGKGVIFLTDSPESARKKIMSATTDDFAEIQYDPISRPGISNLIEIAALLRGSSVQKIAKEYSGKTAYGEFKQEVADNVVDFLNEFQARLSNVNESTISNKLLDSEEKMRDTANKTLLRVQKAVGLR